MGNVGMLNYNYLICTLILFHVTLLHPFFLWAQVAPGSGELVIYGFNIVKPFLTIGVVSGLVAL